MLNLCWRLRLRLARLAIDTSHITGDQSVRTRDQEITVDPLMPFGDTPGGRHDRSPRNVSVLRMVLA
jgi:hypothetical protein